MNVTTIIYLTDVLGSVKALSTFLFICFGVASFIFWVMWMSSFDDSDKEVHIVISRIAKIVTSLAILFILAATLIPAKETMYLMAASEITQDIAKSPEAKQITDKVLKVINGKLDSLIPLEK